MGTYANSDDQDTMPLNETNNSSVSALKFQNQFSQKEIQYIPELSETQNNAYWYAWFFPGTHVFR